MTTEIDTGTLNFRIVLARRPEALVGPVPNDLLRFEQIPVPQLQEGQFQVKIHWMSLDPAVRTWMNGGRTDHAVPSQVGGVVRALCSGKVVASKNEKFQPGAHVEGPFGAQQYSISDGAGVRVVPPDVPLSAFVGVLGVNGISAWIGVTEYAKPRRGDVAIVTAAAGGVGGVAVQLLKAAGCTVIGLAGDDEKCAWARSLGADACVNYKTADVGAELTRLCPAGANVIFDNVGGSMLDLLLLHLHPWVRIVLCGCISRHTEQEEGIKNLTRLHLARASMYGFIYTDYIDRWHEAEADLLARLQRGELRYREHIIEGLEKAPESLELLFDGANRGKLLVKVADEAI